MSFFNKYLDGEKLFTVYWAEMGSARSYAKLQKWCEANKIVNPKTQKVPGRMGLWKSMYRWAVNNPDKAYEIAQQGFRDSGDYLTRERWDAEMKEKVDTSYQSPNFTRRWTKTNVN